MLVKLFKLETKNVFCLGEVNLNLKDRGLTLVTGYSEDENGSNGAGKSSLANKAILWGLWGTTAGGLKADNIVNRHGKRKARVAITFEGIDGAEYQVIRKRPAELILEREGKDVSAKTAKDTQELIDKALGIDFKTFIQTSFFGQGRNLSYPSLTPKDQKAVLEQILPMEEVDRWAAYADTKFKEIQGTVEGVQQEENETSIRLNTLQHEQEKAVVAAEDYQKNLRHLAIETQNKIDNVEKEFDDDKIKLEILQRQVDQIDEVEIGQQIAEHNDAYEVLRRDTHPQAMERVQEAISSLDQWKARKAYLKGEISTLETATACPTCLRPYDDTIGVEKRMQDTRALILEADNNIELGCGAALHYRNARADIDKEIENIKSKLTSLSQVLNNRKLAVLEAQTIETKIKQARETLEKELIRIQSSTNPHDAIRARLDSDITLLEQQKEEINKRLGKILGEYEHLDYWRGVYSKELKLKLFEDACPFLDNRTKYHMGQLKNDQIHVEFSTIKRLATGKVKEEFNVNVWSETGGQGFDSLSGGEQQMVSFAIGLGLADLAGSIASSGSSFLILDEPFSELDDRNSEAIVEYLTGEMGKGKDTIFLISNEETLKGLVPNRIHVVKSKGVSSVSEN